MTFGGHLAPRDESQSSRDESISRSEMPALPASPADGDSPADAQRGDDEIIGRAFLWSLVAMVALAGVVTLGVFWFATRAYG